MRACRNGGSPCWPHPAGRGAGARHPALTPRDVVIGFKPQKSARDCQCGRRCEAGRIRRGASAVGEAPSGWIDFDAQQRAADMRFQANHPAATTGHHLFYQRHGRRSENGFAHTGKLRPRHRLTGGLWLDCKPGEMHWNISIWDGARPRGRVSTAHGRWVPACSHWTFAANLIPLRRSNTLAHFRSTLVRIRRRHCACMCGRTFSAEIPKLRHCVTAGEPLNPEVFKLWRDATGLTLYEGLRPDGNRGR